MDNIILGLLLLCNRTIYQLRDRIDKGMNIMFSSSMGSIQAAIKKLLKNGYIDFEETVENGKYKKIYHISDSGREHFFEWVNAPMESQSGKFPELAKVYFMGFADKESRIKCVEKHLDFLREQYVLLSEICNSAGDTEVPEEMKDIFNYQYVTVMYGRDTVSFHISWFENFLEKIKEDKF